MAQDWSYCNSVTISPVFNTNPNKPVDCIHDTLKILDELSSPLELKNSAAGLSLTIVHEKVSLSLIVVLPARGLGVVSDHSIHCRSHSQQIRFKYIFTVNILFDLHSLQR